MGLCLYELNKYNKMTIYVTCNHADKLFLCRVNKSLYDLIMSL